MAQRCAMWMCHVDVPELAVLAGAAEPCPLSTSMAHSITAPGPDAAPSSSGLPRDWLWRSTRLVESHLPRLASLAGQECKNSPEDLEHFLGGHPSSWYACICPHVPEDGPRISRSQC